MTLAWYGEIKTNHVVNLSCHQRDNDGCVLCIQIRTLVVYKNSMFLLVLTEYLNSMFEYKSIIDNIIVIELNVRLNTQRDRVYHPFKFNKEREGNPVHTKKIVRLNVKIQTSHLTKLCAILVL